MEKPKPWSEIKITIEIRGTDTQSPICKQEITQSLRWESGGNGNAPSALEEVCLSLGSMIRAIDAGGECTTSSREDLIEAFTNALE
jgi:hypothetical protein